MAGGKEGKEGKKEGKQQLTFSAAAVAKSAGRALQMSSVGAALQTLCAVFLCSAHDSIIDASIVPLELQIYDVEKLDPSSI